MRFVTTTTSNGYWVLRLTMYEFGQRLILRFLAPQIPEAIYGKYFAGKKMQGRIDPEFLSRINGTMICLTCAILCHTLRAWQTGKYEEPKDFKPDIVMGKKLRIF